MGSDFASAVGGPSGVRETRRAARDAFGGSKGRAEMGRVCQREKRLGGRCGSTVLLVAAVLTVQYRMSWLYENADKVKHSWAASANEWSGESQDDAGATDECLWEAGRLDESSKG